MCLHNMRHADNHVLQETEGRDQDYVRQSGVQENAARDQSIYRNSMPQMQVLQTKGRFHYLQVSM
jgi:hypothetical protein